jgi:hypothetical protein
VSALDLCGLFEASYRSRKRIRDASVKKPGATCKVGASYYGGVPFPNLGGGLAAWLVCRNLESTSPECVRFHRSAFGHAFILPDEVCY